MLVNCISRRRPPMRRLLISMKRKSGERTRAKFTGQAVRIWSGEHRAWWRPNRQGYTTWFQCAGVYEFEDAWHASAHCGPEKKITYEIADGRWEP